MIAGGDLLRQLLRGYVTHDDDAFRTAAKAIIEEERLKNHRLLADDLEKILINGRQPSSAKRSIENGYEVPKDKERGFALLDIKESHLGWDRIVLPTSALTLLQQISKEHLQRDVLASAGVSPKQRVLFYGPPGCGKTFAAHVLAGVLSFPLITVRFDAIVSSYLGETAANLRRVFDFIQRGQWVVLFDEFDAIGKDRDNPFEHGELKRVVNTLLQLMDAFRGESLLIAATNHEGLLDNAIWRRFEAIVPFKTPSEQDRILLLRHFLKGFNCQKLDLSAVSRRIKGASGADVEWITLEAARHALLDSRSEILKQDIDPTLAAYRDRTLVVRKLSNGTRKGQK
jgi:SpoVK/Ycf46/Vps4 family AAA+-type ATPase